MTSPSLHVFKVPGFTSPSEGVTLELGSRIRNITEYWNNFPGFAQIVEFWNPVPEFGISPILEPGSRMTAYHRMVLFLKRFDNIISVGRCGNPSGRRSFNSARVRHHFFKTMYKLRCSESPSRDSPGSPSTSEVNFKLSFSCFMKILDSNKSSAAAVQLRRFHEAFRLSGTYLSAAAVESTDFFI